MSTFTENYNLIKPDEADYYDVADFNENMDTIDALMTETETVLGEINEKIGLPEDTGNETLFGCMKNSSSVIKSIQRVTYTMEKTTGKAIPISKVDPSKCIVIMERLECSLSYYLEIDYKLEANTLTVIHPNYGSSDLPTFTYGFQIIEFY